MAVVKSGWLLQQSTILKRWKKNWFDLWSDCHLIYYDHTRQSVEDKVHMPLDCINILTGHEFRGEKLYVLGKQDNFSAIDIIVLQAYVYGPYSGAYPPGTQVVYAENGQAYAIPYQYPYAGLRW